MDKNLIPNISVDAVVFGFDTQNLNILLVTRPVHHEGKDYVDWKFPGDLIRKDEDLDVSAERILFEQTGLKNIFLKQLKAFGDLNRLKREPRDMTWLYSIDHPEERVITIPYFGLVNLNKDVSFKTLLKGNARWFPVDEVKNIPVAFDHRDIFHFALEMLRNGIRTGPLAFELLPQKFTLGQLQRIYEVIFKKELDKRNFRKKVATLSYIVPLREKEKGVAHRPARLYMFSKDIYQKLKANQFDFAI
jgi:hypothetical protein